MKMVKCFAFAFAALLTLGSSLAQEMGLRGEAPIAFFPYFPITITLI